MVLGVLILFWPNILYTYYATAAPVGGISLELDQQLGGGLMMVGGWTLLLVIGLPLQYWGEEAE